MPDAAGGVDGNGVVDEPEAPRGGARSFEGGGTRCSREAGDGSARLCLSRPWPSKKRHCSEDCLTWCSHCQARCEADRVTDRLRPNKMCTSAA